MTDTRGTHLLHQVTSVSQLTAALPAITRALDSFDLRGTSLRVPASLVASSFNVYDMMPDKVGIRFMAGRWLPSNVNVGRTYPAPQAQGSRNVAPAPFNADGTPNAQFEAYFAHEVERHAAYCRQVGVPILHLPWYGRDWAEVAHAADVRALQGYSYVSFYDAHKRLVDIAAPFAGPDLTIEFPLSGSGPLPQFIADMSRYVAAHAKQAYLLLQGNGVDHDGIWGAPDVNTERDKDAALNSGVRVGGQMIQPEAYPWESVYGQVRGHKLEHLEIYLQSFSVGDTAELARQVNLFSVPVVVPPTDPCADLREEVLALQNVNRVLAESQANQAATIMAYQDKVRRVQDILNG